jgi:hypothetical protein
MWYHRLSGDDVVGNEPIKAIFNKTPIKLFKFFFWWNKIQKKKKDYKGSL